MVDIDSPVKGEEEFTVKLMNILSKCYYEEKEWVV